MSQQIPSHELDQLEQAKRASVLQLLFKCARLANDRALDRLRQKTGNQAIRQAHITLFPYIDFAGSRLTSIAAQMGVSKQAISQLIAELEEMGLVERIDDPSDGRAKLVRFSSAGRSRILSGLEVLQEVACEFAAQIGQEQMDALHGALLKLERLLED